MHYHLLPSIRLCLFVLMSIRILDHFSSLRERATSRELSSSSIVGWAGCQVRFVSHVLPRALACSALQTRGYRTRGVFERLLLPGLEGCLVQHPGCRRACQGGWFRVPRGVRRRLHGGPIVGVAACFSYSIDCSPCGDFREPKGIILKRRFAFTQLKGRIRERRLHSSSIYRGYLHSVRVACGL